MEVTNKTWERGHVSRTWRDYALLVLKGMLMGAADVVPGVSGGTMAFILGIYEELVLSIRAVARPPVWRALIRGRWQEAFFAVNAPFLIAVGGGILLAVLSLARLLEWLLENRPVFVWSFFFGLVLASVVTIHHRVRRWSLPLVALTLLGALFAYWLVGIVPLQTPNSWWFLILSGALAICAMILPGISGAFILVLLGKYQYVLSAVNDRDILTIALVGVGAVIGLVSFAQILGWLFKRYHDATVAMLIGLMIGSLRKIWPWKETVEFITGPHGAIIPTLQRNVLPPIMRDGGLNGELLGALILALLGFGAVLLIERYLAVELSPTQRTS